TGAVCASRMPVAAARRWRVGGGAAARGAWSVPHPKQRSTALSTVEDDRQPVDGHRIHDPDWVTRKRTGQHRHGRTRAETAHRQRSTIGAPRSHIVEDRAMFWERMKAANSVSAAHGLNGAARPKGLEPLTF